MSTTETTTPADVAAAAAAETETPKTTPKPRRRSTTTEGNGMTAEAQMEAIQQGFATLRAELTAEQERQTTILQNQMHDLKTEVQDALTTPAQKTEPKAESEETLKERIQNAKREREAKDKNGGKTPSPDPETTAKADEKAEEVKEEAKSVFGHVKNAGKFTLRAITPIGGQEIFKFAEGYVAGTATGYWFPDNFISNRIRRPGSGGAAE